MGEIFGRWEAKGFELIASRLLVVSPRLSSEHYAEHRGKSFFQGLVRYASKGAGKKGLGGGGLIAPTI